LAAGAFLAEAAFLVAGFAAALLAVFFAAAGFTPAAFALAAACFLSRAALFLCMMPFLTALSSSLWMLLWAAAAGFLVKALSAVFRERLVLLLRTAALLATLTRFLADLMIGMGVYVPYRLKVYMQSTINYTRFTEVCKGSI
jgi:hypothetical protein